MTKKDKEKIREVKKDEILSTYYGEEGVTAIITVKADTQFVDLLANEIAKLDNVDDVFLVTGDIDIFIKARVEKYSDLKDFILDRIASLPGLKDTKTLIAVATYKERGAIVSTPEKAREK